jgi:hypothetical protein|eukprot:COSAG01_NODE_3446_length_6086_cov_13.460999_7_plen_568_part_00
MVTTARQSLPVITAIQSYLLLLGVRGGSAASGAAPALLQQPLQHAQQQCPQTFTVTTDASCNNATLLPGNPRVAAAGVGACCAACAAQAGCETFVFTDPETTSSPRNCRLAGKCPGLHHHSSSTKEKKTCGVRGGSPSPPPPPPLPPQSCAAFQVTTGASCPNASASVKVVTSVTSVAACCAACVAYGPRCGTFVFTDPEGPAAAQAMPSACLLKGVCPGLKHGVLKTVGTRPVPPPLPPLPPPPLPPPVPPGSQKNVIVLLTDDQDLRLGSMRAMPYTSEHIGRAGVNISNFFVHTPICCPSRTTLLGGRFYHNNKVSLAGEYDPEAPYSGCMSMNTSLVFNPGFWESSIVATLKKKGGFATGLFGKVLNAMDSYGCTENFTTPYVDRFFVMCNHNFFNERWADSLDPNRANNRSVAINATGTDPEDYTTSQIGNASLAWIRTVVESGPDHPPFFAWLGPHAPHKPSTPASWYADHPIGNLPLIKGPYFNYAGTDKHVPLSIEPPISEADEAAIVQEQAYRLRSLLSVDDLVRGLREYLVEAGEWNRTYWIFTSDREFATSRCLHV